MKTKKLISVFSAIAIVLFVASSCNEVEDLFGDMDNSVEGYEEAIYTVRASYIQPELSDTSFYVSNIKDLGIKSGTRGVMRLKYKYDLYAGLGNAIWTLDEVMATIPTRLLTPPDEIDSTHMNSYFTDVTPYIRYGATWFWNGIQNINVVYQSDGSSPEFAMTSSGITGDTLRLSLWGKIPTGTKKISDLLSFDLTTLQEIISENDYSRLITKDSLYTTITMTFGDSDDTETATIRGGFAANPFKTEQ